MKARTGDTRRNANTAVSTADAVLLSMTQIESWTFATSRHRSKLLTSLTMEARLLRKKAPRDARLGFLSGV